MEFMWQRVPVLQAAPAGAGGGQLMFTLVTFGLVFLIMYLLIIRPQNKRQKEQQKMLDALKKGDRVTTIGGIRGTIISIKDDTVVLKVDDSTKLEMSRSSVSSLLEKKPKAKASKAAETESQEDEEEA